MSAELTPRQQETLGTKRMPFHRGETMDVKLTMVMKNGHPQWFYDITQLTARFTITDGFHIMVSERIAETMQTKYRDTVSIEDVAARGALIAAAVEECIATMVADRLLRKTPGPEHK